MRLDRPLELPDGMPEAAVYERMAELAARNASAESEITFLGAGMYDHYVPAIVDSITQRSEFLTPYTPYQPEISQGTLQAMFEFQTAISELTGLPVASAGLYEVPSSVAAAGYLARNATGRDRFLVSRGLHPHAREALATYAAGFGAEVDEVPLAGGATDLAALEAAVDERVAAVFLQQPNFLGTVEDLAALAPVAKRAGAPARGHGGRAHARRSCARRASSARTSRSARASRSATASTTAARRSASSPRARSTSAACRAASRARPPTSTAGAASCSPCRRASSTSGARRRRRTSAPASS